MPARCTCHHCVARRDIPGVAGKGDAEIPSFVNVDVAMHVAWCGHLAEWYWSAAEVTLLRANIGRRTTGNPRFLAYRTGTEAIPNLTEI